MSFSICSRSSRSSSSFRESFTAASLPYRRRGRHLTLASMAAQSEDRVAVLVELSFPHSGNSGEVLQRLGGAFGDRLQRRVREHDVGGDLLLRRHLGAPFLEREEQFLVQLGRAVLAAAELAFHGGGQRPPAHPARLRALGGAPPAPVGAGGGVRGG